MFAPRARVGCLLLSMLLLAMPATPAAADELLLVEDGVSRAPIIVPDNPLRFTREAANELAGYIEKVSGARPKVIEGAPDDIPKHAIWVGDQPVLDDLLPDVDVSFEHPEEILIAANENHLVIAGRDRSYSGMSPVEIDGDMIRGVQQEYGTANAVYTFLQKYLDVRWLWPGELGEDIVERDTIRFEPFTYRYHPQIRGRGGLLAFSSLNNSGYGHSHQWTRRQRLQLDSLSFSGGHAFGNWWERFHEDHPDYFALQPDGTRSGYPRPHTVKLCQSNPDVWDQWLKDVEAQLENNPNQKVFNGASNDGYNAGICICEDCRAWDEPDAEQRTYHWEGMGSQYPAMSDRYVRFANRLARKLKERYPDKEYYVMTMAYGHSRPAPIEAVPDDNVIIASVTGFWRFDMPEGGSPNNTTHGEQFSGWANVANQMIWRPNTGSPVGWRHGLPDVPLNQMAENFKYITERGTVGIYVDSVWEHWGTQGPLYYMMAQLAWDPSKDHRAILDDYYRRGFGPAAEAIESYWQLMEQRRNAFVDDTGSWSINKHYDALPEHYDAAFFERAEGILDRAAEQATDADPVYGKRVALVRAGLDYTRLAVQGRAAIQRYKQSDGTDTDAKQTARARWEQIDQLRKAHPMAVNWTCIGGHRDPLNCDFLPTISPRWRD